MKENGKSAPNNSAVPKETQKEISAGIIVFRRTQDGPKFLVLYHGSTYWNFPKGKLEKEERSFEAALRETREETGLGQRDLRIIRDFKTREQFTFRRRNQRVFKIVLFYLAETTNPRVRLSDEHQGYGWFPYREASRILGKYEESQKVLKEANDFICGKGPRRGGQSNPRQHPAPPTAASGARQ